MHKQVIAQQVLNQ
jgi:hypothetical protein